MYLIFMTNSAHYLATMQAGALPLVDTAVNVWILRNQNIIILTQQYQARRAITYIFTPYSVTSLGDTANDKYLKMNRNFKKIHFAESKLSLTQKSLFSQFLSLNKAEITVYQKELYLELRTFRETVYSNFLFDLTQIFRRRDNTLPKRKFA